MELIKVYRIYTEVYHAMPFETSKFSKSGPLDYRLHRPRKSTPRNSCLENVHLPATIAINDQWSFHVHLSWGRLDLCTHNYYNIYQITCVWHTCTNFDALTWSEYTDYACVPVRVMCVTNETGKDIYECVHICTRNARESAYVGVIHKY